MRRLSFARSPILVVAPGVLIAALASGAGATPHIYFGSSSAGGGLVRANLDGSGLQFVVPATGTFINGVGVDPLGGHLYYSGGGTTYRAELGGANPQILFDEAFDYIDVDPIAGRIAAARSNLVILANLDGSERVDIVEDPLFASLGFGGIAVDVIAGEVCYAMSDFDRTVVRCRAYDDETSYTVYDVASGSGSLYPVAIDPLRRKIWHGDNGNVHRTDLDTLEDDDLSAILPSYSGRALEIDPVGGQLYYRGSLNTVRVIDVDLTDAVEIIPEAEPSISRDAALSTPVPVARALHRLVPLPPGDESCPDGGVRIDFGADDGTPGGTAYNNALEDDEVDSSVVVCGGDAATSCTVSDGGNGTFTLTCPDGTSATWSDGQDGTDGQNGTNGTDGADGADGADGSSCSVEDHGDGTATITCDDGTSATVGGGGGGCAASAGAPAGALALLLLALSRRAVTPRSSSTRRAPTRHPSSSTRGGGTRRRGARGRPARQATRRRRPGRSS